MSRHPNEAPRVPSRGEQWIAIGGMVALASLNAYIVVVAIGRLLQWLA